MSLRQEDVTTALTCPPSRQELSSGSELCMHLLVLGSSETQTELRTISLILAHFCALFNGSTVSCISSENQDVPDLHWSTLMRSWVLTAQCLLQQACPCHPYGSPPTDLSFHQVLHIQAYMNLLEGRTDQDPSCSHPSEEIQAPRQVIRCNPH